MKKHRLLSSALILSFFLIPLNSVFSQDMEITDATTGVFTPEDLINNIFLGDGVEVIDVTFEGDPLAVGFFKNATEEVGIERGIIMSSGRASNAGPGGPFGAQGVGSQFASSDVASNASDPDIAAITNVSTNDVCKFSITFVPTADTLRFSYVFASEEYPEFACTSFNDVFGFFISGPGLSGPFEDDGINIALIPGTNTPVAINNVHPQNGGGCPPVFEEFYNNNNGSSNQPTYDGVLDVFVAEAIVTPCEEYTIKLIIADGGDQIYDSGVFLEAKSFGTGTLQVEAATVSLDGTITEGCADGTVTFRLPNPPEEDFIIDYTIIGSAENGVDYDSIPADLFIAAGDTSVSFPIIAISDGIDEGLESIGIDVQRDICNRDTFWIFVRDDELVPPELGPDTTICRTDTVQLDGTLDIPLPDPPTFTNTNDVPIAPSFTPVTSDILVAGVQPIFLGPGVIQSVCLNIDHKWVDDLDLFLISPGGQFIELSSDNGANCDNYINTCFTPSATNPIQDAFPIGSVCSSGENPPFTGEFAPEGVWSDLWDGEHPTNGIWQLLAIDDQNGFTGTILDWTITFEPLYQVFYRWEPEIGLSCDDCPNPLAYPDETTTYTLTAWDTYGCEVQDSITINVLDILPPPNVQCGNITTSTISINWSDINGANGYEVNINGDGWINPNGNLEHLISGLGLEDTITFEVRGLSDCDGEIQTVVCWTPECDAPIPNVEAFTNVSCFGGNDGSTEVSASGGLGSGNYTFELNGETNTTGIFENLTAGLWDVMVTDELDCTNFIQVNIAQPDSFIVNTVLVNDVSCNGGNDGSVTAEIIGGNYPYTFNWNNSQADSIATELSIGEQFLTITDDLGCELTASIEVEEPEALALTTDSTEVSCNGGNNGTATINVTGGAGSYTYLWDSNAADQTDPTAVGLAIGNYQVTATDLNGCEIIGAVEVTEPEALSIALNMTPLNCFESNDGSASVSATGGVGDYTYEWNNAGNSEMIDNISSGVFIVTVSDENGCSIVDSITVTQPEVLALNLVPTNVSCNDGDDGSIMAEVVGGMNGYTYAWDNGGNQALNSGLIAQNYCLTVTDGNGCEIIDCIEITQPEALALSFESTPAGCNGSADGTINLTVAGGTGNYSYDWSNGSDEEDLMGLAEGDYSVIVTDENNCQASLDVTLVDSDAIQVSFSSTDINCFNGSDGSIDVTATGGVGGFQYDWTGPNGFTSSLEDPDGLEAGDYSVVITDGQGCIFNLNVNLSQPATAIEASVPTPGTICFEATDGTATVDVQGGVPPYDYNWSNGQTTPTANNMDAGIYLVTVTDQNGCVTIETAIIQQQQNLTFNLAQTGAGCHDGNDGSAEITEVFYGNNAATISDFDIDWNVPNQSDPQIANLIGGQTYQVTITDALGCTASNSIQIDNPEEIESSVEVAKIISCYEGADGEAIAVGGGGTEPYSFLWSSNSGSQNTAMAVGLTAGSYIVTVTDANGCSTTSQVSLEDPTQVSVDFINKAVECNGESNGASVASIEGGTGPYSILWGNGQTTNTAENLPGGYQSIMITDANGCVLNDSTLITQPEFPVNAQYELLDVTCAGYQDGEIILFPDGGTPPYTYSIDGQNYYGASNIIGLSPDNYSVYIKDSRGCIFTANGLDISEPDPLSVDIGEDHTIEYGNSIQFQPFVTGADPSNLTFEWTSNDTTSSLLNPNEFNTTAVVYNPTTFNLVVTDENGCVAEDAIVIFINTPRAVQVPTAFTPNGDGENDFLHVHGKSKMVSEIKSFQIFDRWGELLYQIENFGINDMTLGWNGQFQGQDMSTGVYVWVLEVEYVDGVKEILKGSTTLLR